MQGSFLNGSGTYSRSRSCFNVSSHGKNQKVQERRELLKDYENYSRSTNDEEDYEEVDRGKRKGATQKDSSPDEALGL